MNTPPSDPAPQSPDLFTIERHGELTLITASPRLESLDSSMEQNVVDLLLSPLRRQTGPQVVFDLTGVEYFGSMFLAVLLRCWKLIMSTGGSLVLAGVTPQAKELLRITSLDLMWPIYKDKREAMSALESD